jgi:hypothetical protein
LAWAAPLAAAATHGRPGPGSGKSRPPRSAVGGRRCLSRSRLAFLITPRPLGRNTLAARCGRTRLAGPSGYPSVTATAAVAAES